MPTTPPQPRLSASARWWSYEHLLLIVFLGIFFFLPGLGQIPLFDRDEPRFATAARTMGQTGDLIVPHFNGALRPDKPPLVYWLMNLTYAATGGWGELGARLPSALAGIGTLLTVYFMVGSRFGRLTGFLASVLLVSTTLFIVESRLSTADGTMVFFITLCMACAWQAWDAHPHPAPRTARLPRADFLLDRTADRNPLVLDHLPAAAQRKMPLPLALLFWLSLAAGTLTKGVPLLFVLVPMIILSLATGTLPGLLAQWRSHFHLTRNRVIIASLIAGAAALALTISLSANLFPDARTFLLILACLLIGMTLLPGLPGVLARCLTGGNWGWWKQLRPLIGIPLLLVATLWWVFLAGHQTDWVLIKDMVGIHFLNRTVGPLMKSFGITFAESAANVTKGDPMGAYAKPPGFYTALVWVTFWPWSVLLVPAAYHMFRRLRGKTAIAIDHRPYQFLLCWILPMWILLELARGKLLHYPLPVYIPLVILCADTLVQSWYRLTDVLSAAWFASLRWVILFIWLGMGAALLIGAGLYLDSPWFWRCVPFAAALIATGFVSTSTWGRRSWPFTLALAWGGSLFLASSLILPELPALQVSRTLGRAMADLKRQDPSFHLAASGYEEPTLVFYAGENVEMLSSPDALLAKVPFAPLAQPTEHYLVAVSDATLQDLRARGIQFDLLRTVRGYNAANFKPIATALITNLPPAATTPATSPATATAPHP